MNHLLKTEGVAVYDDSVKLIVHPPLVADDPNLTFNIGEGSFDVSVRTWNCLKGLLGPDWEGDVDAVCALTERDLRYLPGFGKKSSAELMGWLARHGRRLGEVAPPKVLNTSGINPTEFRVLIDPKPAEEKIGSIIIPLEKAEREKYATMEGTIVAVSHLAFTYATPEEWAGKKPKPGDHVLYAKYAGVRHKGKDGQEYLLVNDKDIVATIEE